MPISQEEVIHIARLARLRLTPVEIESFRRQLSDILDYFTRLQELDTTGIEPTAGLQRMQGALRTDEPGQCLSASQLLQNAPDPYKGQFRVPPVQENNP